MKVKKNILKLNNPREMYLKESSVCLCIRDVLKVVFKPWEEPLRIRLALDQSA